MRFSIRSMLILTAAVAAYTLMLRDGGINPGAKAWAGFAVLVAVVGWTFYSLYKAERTMMSEDGKQEKRDD